MRDEEALRLRSLMRRGMSRRRAEMIIEHEREIEQKAKQKKKKAKPTKKVEQPISEVG